MAAGRGGGIPPTPGETTLFIAVGLVITVPAPAPEPGPAGAGGRGGMDSAINESSAEREADTPGVDSRRRRPSLLVRGRVRRTNSAPAVGLELVLPPPPPPPGAVGGIGIDKLIVCESFDTAASADVVRVEADENEADRRIRPLPPPLRLVCVEYAALADAESDGEVEAAARIEDTADAPNGGITNGNAMPPPAAVPSEVGCMGTPTVGCCGGELSVAIPLPPPLPAAAVGWSPAPDEAAAAAAATAFRVPAAEPIAVGGPVAVRSFRFRLM